LQLDDLQHPWIVWQYGYGSVYSIACSHFSSQGEILSAELTPGATTHNLDPKIFFVPAPTVYWYVAQSDQFYLVGSKYNEETGDWLVSPPENFENLPADNLPELFKTGRGPFAAIWYDQAPQQNNGVISDHVFLGLQNAETKGRGEAIDQQPGSDYHSVGGLTRGDRFVTTWVSESYVDGAQIYLGIGNSPVRIHPVRMSDGETAINTNPHISSANNEVAVAWEEQSLTGAWRIALRVMRLPQ
jgi:hypothetical protein